MNEDTSLSSGEERLLFDVKEEEGFQNNAAGGESLVHSKESVLVMM